MRSAAPLRRRSFEWSLSMPTPLSPLLPLLLVTNLLATARKWKWRWGRGEGGGSGVVYGDDGWPRALTLASGEQQQVEAAAAAALSWELGAKVKPRVPRAMSDEQRQRQGELCCC